MDLADSGPLSRVGLYSGAGRDGFPCRIRDYHPLWSNFPERSSNAPPSPAIKGSPVLHPRRDESRRFGLVPVPSPLLRQSLLLSFPGGNEMFQFPPFATHAYGFSVRLFG